MAESNDSNVIKEGFICPICHKDMRSPNNLLSHFQDQHSEEQDILSSLKELVGKAKKKILKLDEQDLEFFKTEFTLKKYYIEESEPQHPGHISSHTDYFKTVRRERLDHRTTETNKLIIRLDRLLRVQGSDRKQEEQRIVTWLDGTSVTRCPSCAASFNITRRQHHCRLCGSIMCNNCSCFLTYEVARSIIAPVNMDSNGAAQENSKSEVENIRICSHCMDMLECRRFIQMNQVVQSSICKLYEHLQKIKSELQPLVETYHKMYMLLTSGDTTYQLQDAQSLRSSIAKQAETLDLISKKIAALPIDADTPKAVSLQNAIRRATSHYIKEYLLILPSLPTPAELERIKLERRTRSLEISRSTPVVNVKKVTVTTGWSPANVSAENEVHEDPLIEQIKRVRNYIKQAQEAQRFEEVRALRENLKMLQDNYQRNQVPPQTDN